MSEFRPDRIRRIEQLACARATHRADALAAEGPMPCDGGVSEDVRASIAAIDRAVAAGDVRRALECERRLPASIDADPAIVDRVATLRLLEGDAVTALAVLGAVARPTPRLDLLRAVALLALDDADSLDLHLEELADEPAARPLASIVAAILTAAGGANAVVSVAEPCAALRAAPKDATHATEVARGAEQAVDGALDGALALDQAPPIYRDVKPDQAPPVYRDVAGARRADQPPLPPLHATHHYRDLACTPRRTDPTPAFCSILTTAIAARASRPPSHQPAHPAARTAVGLGEAALHELTLLLSAFTAPTAPGSRPSLLARRVSEILSGLARDFGLTHAIAHPAVQGTAAGASPALAAESVAIRVSDRKHLPWRVSTPAPIRPGLPATTSSAPSNPQSSTAIAA
ncbi:MAG: hypothetical protein JNM94_03875 [Phycisphaerae bacterium]|nr:hypothetical protein [Phycisphaerae bacterium]